MPKRETEGKSLSDLMGGMSKSVSREAGRLVGKTPVDQEAAKKLFAEADVLYRQAAAAKDAEKPALFEAAAVKYQAAAKQWHDSSLEEDALFAAGDAYLLCDKYPKANEVFEQLLKKYPRTKHVDAAQGRRFKIAQWWLDQSANQNSLTPNMTDKTQPSYDTFGNAIRIYDRIRKDDPAGKFADAATIAEANAYFRRGQWDKADVFYDDLRKTFPASQYQFQAHFLGLKSKLSTYRGPDYDGTALDEAEKLVGQIQKQFPQEYERERDFLVRAAAEIRFKKAQREMHLAKYYDNRAEYAAANFYYNQVTHLYSDTPQAKEAGERIAAIEGKPGVPPKYFDWLESVFPPSPEHRPLLATLPDDTKKR